MLSDSADYLDFVAGDSEFSVRLAFTADSEVRDFKVLAVQLEDVDENGNPQFAADALYTLERLTPELPLAVTMTFYGDMPNNGFSFVDAAGVTRRFAIDLSGRDGSLVLWEF